MARASVIHNDALPVGCYLCKAQTVQKLNGLLERSVTLNGEMHILRHALFAVRYDSHMVPLAQLVENIAKRDIVKLE